ncbi:cadherin-99C isoform X2 [Centruroides vittatus]
MKCSSNFLITIFVLFANTRWCHGLCETEGTDSVIILDITESRGNSTDQVTVPSELPIRGDLNQVELTIQSATRDYFTLEGKKLRLKRPLDRDSDEITQIRLNIICRELSTSNQRNIPVLIRVTDINDNAPIFKENSYSCSVSELAPVGTTIFRDLSAIDKDANNNGLVEYYTVKGDGTHHDGYRSFAINLPYQGLVTVNKSLDYESTQKYYLTIQAVDRADRPEDRLTATTTLTIFVEDGDDQDPAFLHSGCTFVNNACVNVEYTAEVTSGALAGILKIRPDNINAKDRDSLNSPIKYSFVNGTPLFYSEYFQIDPKRGNIRQIKAVDRSVSKIFSIIIKAEEETEGKRFTTAKLTVDVLPVDNNPPIITPTALIGYVDENSPVGTTVVTARDGKEPLKLMVTDADIAPDDPPVEYIFELTTNSFRVNADGYLVVNEAELDRDPPNPSKYTFQVIARQVNSTNGRGASAPITLNVHLNDVNDNSPRLPSLSPVRIQAGEGVRPVTQVQARDNDVGEFAKVTYSIYHVSNNGMSKFRVDPDSGHIQVVDKVVAGEQYSITIQATDTGGRFMQSIVDVIVVPGPNTGGPVFSKDKYEIQVSEGASLNSAVITVIAEDPERDKVKYSIIEGNINKDFDIGPNSGVIFVAKKLDREEVSTYNLLVKAEDPSGLFNTATVSITVTDINDQNPIFLQDNYTFVVDEGLVRAPIGVVQARDDDIGTNGEVLYSVSGNNDFSINPQSGEIHVKKILDYEKQKKHLLVVTARDKAPDARLATASVTVLVNDVQDEKPIFTTPVYEAIVPENLPHQEIVQVQATDPDSVSSITYILKDAEPGLFAVDPVTGVVRTLRGLDFEYKNTYRLTVGTLENDSNDPRATCTVLVTVQDRNDVPPTFTSVPLPIRLQDTVPLGTVVTTVVATDADGTPPGNQVRYELSGRDKAPYYFLIDGNSGVVSVKDDLRKEPDSEYRIEVRARDLGEPSLSATATITVYVEHIVTIPPNSGLGFADSHYTVEVEENSLANTLIKVLPVINKPRGNFPIGCEIVSGNEQGHFYVSENEARDCEIRTRDQGLDYEKTSRYTLIINLNTVEGFFGSSRLSTQVIINIIDLNDNRPQFVIPPRYSQLTSNRYLAALSSDAPVGTKFFQVISKDSDSGSNSRLSYEINRESDPENRFKIDSTSGFISNNKPVEDIVAEDLPLQLQLVVRDNPDLLSSSLLQTVEVLINVINDDNRMVLVVKDALPNRMLDMKENILSVIQERTGIIPDFEKVSILKLLKNNSIETDSTGSDFWFYMVDPVTFRILDRNDPRIQSTVLEDDSQLGLVTEVSSVLGIKAKYIRLPFVLTNPDNGGGNTKHGVKPVKAEVGVSDLGAALIALACIIVLLGVVGIIYHCFMWSRYVAYRERMKRLCVAPRYEPVFVEPSLKEYETQVLQMSVPLDEEGSIPDPNLPINLKGLDAVSYITRDRGDGSASAFGGRTLSTFRGDSISQVDKMKIENNSMNTHPKLEDDMMIPVKNPLYDGYLDDIDDEPSLDRDDLDLKETQQKSSKTLHKIPHVETTTEL